MKAVTLRCQATRVKQLHPLQHVPQMQHASSLLLKRDALGVWRLGAALALLPRFLAHAPHGCRHVSLPSVPVSLQQGHEQPVLCSPLEIPLFPSRVAAVIPVDPSKRLQQQMGTFSRLFLNRDVLGVAFIIVCFLQTHCTDLACSCARFMTS